MPRKKNGNADEPVDDENVEVMDDEHDDSVWEEGDPADRRRDPLRKPAS
ncbi:MAG TPA: hypothetical protein VF846_13990 [Thermoanaerobaculia bacterium]|jgi:hypothetical protein